MRTARTKTTTAAILGAIAMMALGTSATHAAPQDPPASVSEAPITAVPELTSVSPSSVTSYAYTTFTLTGKNFGGVTEVFAEDTSFDFTRVSDTEITFSGSLGGSDAVALRVAGPAGSSKLLTIKILPTVWEVPADDLTVTYGQAAKLSGDFSKLTQKDPLFFAVGDELSDPDSTEGSRAFLTLAPRSLDVGEYPVVIGAYAPARAIAASDAPEGRVSGTLRVVQSPTVISHTLTGQVLTGTVAAKYDSVPSGSAIIERSGGAAPVTVELDNKGSFTLDGFTGADAGFTITYAGNLNHEQSKVVIAPVDPVTPPVVPVKPPVIDEKPVGPVTPTPDASLTSAQGNPGEIAETGAGDSMKPAIGIALLATVLGAASLATAYTRRHAQARLR